MERRGSHRFSYEYGGPASDRRYLSEDSMSQLYPERDSLAAAELTAGN